MRYCENCGTQLRDDAKFCSACGNPCRTEKIEKTAICCKKCGATIEETDLFCAECGEPCCTLDEYEQSIEQTPDEADINWLCLTYIIGCAFCWFFAPFVAINIMTLGNPPTALQLMLDDVTYFGNLSDSIAFWAAIFSMIGIIICFLTTISKQKNITRVVAFLTEVPLFLALYDMIRWVDDADELFEALGFGFWGIFILLFLVICSGNSGKSIHTTEESSLNN